MKLSDVVQVMESIAPTRHAESWDNVGLLVGDPAQPVQAAILTIDYAPEVACEAAGLGCDLIIAYHPPIFDGLKRITSSGTGASVFDAIRRGVAIYSPHTALDVADGGTNDMLADAIGLTDRGPLRLAQQAQAGQCKLVTFVPEADVEKVSQALFDAGAGRIGAYSHCSFRSPGTGTFFGQEGSNPAVGHTGRLERVAELRVETVVPLARLAEVVRALRSAHPYEEPAFDLNQLATPPDGMGMGRIGTLPPTPREQVLARIKRELGIERLLVAGPATGQITRAAACAGACGDLLNEAIAQKAELYLTGEMRHHDALKAARAGLTVACTLHSNSERAVLKRVAGRLTRELPELRIAISQKDRDPFQVL